METEMEMEDGGEEGSVLPEELVGRIISMIPFPHIFKARALSKSWRARFSPIADLTDEEEIRNANLFQKQVAEQSQNWETCFSIIFGTRLSFAPDWATGKRSRLPSLAFLPEKFQMTKSDPDIEGPLLYGCVRSTQLMYVANVLTRSWKKLPPHLNAGGSIFCWKKLVIDASLKGYKVIVFCRDPEKLFYGCLAHIYDSKTHAWTCKKLVVSSKKVVVSKNFKTLSRPVLLNGVLYMVTDHDMKTLLAFDVGQETLREINLSFSSGLAVSDVALVVCNANLLMIVTEDNSSEGLHVLKVDLNSQQLFEMARGPLAVFNLTDIKIRPPVSDGDSVFFGVTSESGDHVHMVAYNVKRDWWRCFTLPYGMGLAFKSMSYYDWSAITFQPGLNPFVEV